MFKVQAPGGRKDNCGCLGKSVRVCADPEAARWRARPAGQPRAVVGFELRILSGRPPLTNLPHGPGPYQGNPKESCFAFPWAAARPAIRIPSWNVRPVLRCIPLDLGPALLLLDRALIGDADKPLSGGGCAPAQRPLTSKATTASRSSSATKAVHASGVLGDRACEGASGHGAGGRHADSALVSEALPRVA